MKHFKEEFLLVTISANIWSDEKCFSLHLMQATLLDNVTKLSEKNITVNEKPAALSNLTPKTFWHCDSLRKNLLL